MQYRNFGKTGEKVSVLGFGCMRLPTRSDDTIDERLTETMLKYAIDHGVNYIDTAYPYHKGESENVVGRVLEGEYRKKVHLVTKSPVFRIKSSDEFDSILDEQLRKLRTDHIDMYLLHNLNGRLWKKVKQLHLLDHLVAAKKAGKVRHIGFSMHDNFDVYKEIVDGFPDCEFSMIQLNYYDEELQAGIQGLKYGAEKGLGMAIMEPLRGGFLANPPKEITQIFQEAASKKSCVEWAFDYLWNKPEVSLLLSGMGSMQMVGENIESAQRSAVGMLSPVDTSTIQRVQKRFGQYDIIPCTGCNYCIPCPMNVAIPKIFEIYNQLKMGIADVEKARKMYRSIYIGFGTVASECFDCFRCERHCPQKIRIAGELKKVREILEVQQ
ncbi:MAG: aldo/keto reductase [Thermoguttaceae bacterium]|nr:aldo/keto reductase [Thermoguttaceae bacterium]